MIKTGAALRNQPHSTLNTPNSLLAREVLRSAIMKLQQAHIESASLDGRILLEHVLGVNREQLLFLLDLPITSEQYAKLNALVERRCERQPIAQLVGKREFWGMDFSVTADTLDPRPDSETLIEYVLEYAANRASGMRILDLGTGTGCLLLSLLSEFPRAKGVGIDFSDKALVIAKENAIALGFSERSEFIESSWFENVSGKFDIIVSNPPYIPTAIISMLGKEVAEYEPKTALDGGKDGLECYRVIMESLPDFLETDGFAAFEFGMGQKDSVENIAAENNLVTVGVRRDLSGIERCIIVKHKQYF